MAGGVVGHTSAVLWGRSHPDGNLSRKKLSRRLHTDSNVSARMPAQLGQTGQPGQPAAPDEDSGSLTTPWLVV